MTRRSYGQYCPVARTLELVGERWTLLIVRELILGPMRFTDLNGALPGIPRNLLAERLRDLEGYGLLARWGLSHLDPPGPDEEVSPVMAVLAGLAAHVRPTDGDETYRLEVDGREF